MRGRITRWPMRRAWSLRCPGLCYTSRVIRLLTTMLVAAFCMSAPTDGFAGKKRARGKLKIQSTVDGALVELNGLKAGKTPLKTMRLKTGRYTLRISKIGHLPFEVKVVVKAGRVEQVLADLLPVAGVLDVQMKPHGAKIFVDGVLTGKSPTILELKLGKRDIEISSEGYLSFRRRVNAIPGDLIELKGNLELLEADPFGDLALVPLARGSDPLEDDLALVPLEALSAKKPAVNDDPLALEPLVPLAPLTVAKKPGRLAPMDVTTQIADRQPWYENWWVLGSAGAVLVSSAVVTAVVLSGGGSSIEVDSYLDLDQSTPTSW